MAKCEIREKATDFLETFARVLKRPLFLPSSGTSSQLLDIEYRVDFLYRNVGAG